MTTTNDELAERTEHPVSRRQAWIDVLGTTAVLWVVLGIACFGAGTEWAFATYGVSLQGAFALDMVFFAGMCAVIAYVWWRQRSIGQGFRELGWGAPARTLPFVVAIVFAVLWASTAYLRGADPLAWSWQRPVMMAVGLVIAVAEETAVRGIIMDRLHRAGHAVWLQCVVSGVVMGVYHGLIGWNYSLSSAIFSTVAFGLISALFIWGGRSLTIPLVAHALLHILGDPALTLGILEVRELL